MRLLVSAIIYPTVHDMLPLLKSSPADLTAGHNSLASCRILFQQSVGALKRTL